MLEQIVQKFRGIVLFAIVAALSAVFVLQFGGPQAEGCSGAGTATGAAKVYGETISRNEFQSAFVLAGGENYPEELAKQTKLKDMVLYGLIERELLARKAREIGFDSSEDAVLARLAEDGLIYLSMSVDAGSSLRPSGPQRFDFSDSDGKFSKENIKRFIQYRLRRSIKEFARSQIEETLAQRMREAVTANIIVSPGELWDAYVREKESVTLKYARFSKAYYAEKFTPSEAEITKWIADHKAEVDAEYEREKHRYTGLEKQVRARHILIKVPSDASEIDKQAAREKAEALREKAVAGADFAELARENSDDTGSAKKGGDLGYNPKGRMVTPFDDAQFALAPGEISDVVESSFGFHVIKVEGVREGDVPVDEAKRELGEKLYRHAEAVARAKAAAEALLAKLKAGTSVEDADRELLGLPPKKEGEETASEDTPRPDPLAPQFKDTRPFGRTDTAIPGPFDSTPLVKAAYALTVDKPLPEEPMQLGDDWFVYRLEARTDADKEGFTDSEQARFRNAIAARRKRDALKAYVHQLMEQAQEDNAVFVDDTLLASAAEPTDKPPSTP